MLIPNEQKILRSILFLLLVLLAAGCATRNPNPPEQGIVSDAPLDQDEGIVFGTLSSGDSKDNTGPGTRYFINYGPKPDAFNPELKNWVLQGHTLYPVFFAQRLPAGEYHVSGLTVGNGNAYVRARFTVASNKATYIGSLQVGFFRGEQGIFLGSNTRVGMRVTSEFDKALQQYKQRNPRLPYEITTNLMKF